MLEIDNETDLELTQELVARLERAAAAALAAGDGPAAADAQVDLTLVGDDRIRELNRTYLDVDDVTDVLSFSLYEGGPEEHIVGQPLPLLLGDVVISVGQAAEQAVEYGHDLATEIALLVVHGVLHLLGHGDETPPEQEAMRRMEAEAMASAGFTPGGNG
ncbi:MAG: rRNA maturation RNase YbeY [Bacillota bacterium]|nr:rRNA maturation RNase YbeY [Bacillota bacterium]